jgi:hypothetical protein
LGKTEVGFRVAAYDRGKPLVIDPILAYSTYLGGGSDDDGYAIAVDGSGNAYVTGYTLSSDFPTTGALQGANGGPVDVFVSKLNPSGSALVYSTYLGGGTNDYGYGIAVDDAGNAYVTGDTWSTDFPMSNPLQGTNAGDDDAFVTKLNASGSALVYSTYLGGGFYDAGYAIAVDASRSVYVTGFTWSTNFNTAAPLQGIKGGSEDAFVSKIDASGAALVYSTYLGGASFEEGHGIAVDGSGNAYVTGYTASTNFPTAGPFQGANAGSYDAFVSKINSAGSALAYSSYLGGGSDDSGNGIAVDGSGNVYVTGYTASTNFPTAGPFQGTKSAGNDAFVSKIGESTPESIPAFSRLGVGLLLLLLLIGGSTLLTRSAGAPVASRLP